MAESSEMREAVSRFPSRAAACGIQRTNDFEHGRSDLELIQLKNIHSDADTAIWLPKSALLFLPPPRRSNDSVFCGGSSPSTTLNRTSKNSRRSILTLSCRRTAARPRCNCSTKPASFYDVLLERVGKQIAQGKSVDEIKKDPDLPNIKAGPAEKRARHQYRGRLSRGKKNQ